MLPLTLPLKTPAAFTLARTVPRLFRHSCKFVVWPAAPLNTSA